MSQSNRGTFGLWRVDLGGVIVCGILSIAGYLLGARPLLASRTDAEHRALELSQTQDHVLSLGATIRSLRAQLAASERKLAECNVELGTSESVNQRMAALTELANRAGLEVQHMQTGATTPGQHVSRLPIELSAAGSFRQSCAFFHELRKQCPDTAVRGFDLTGNPSDPRSPLSFTVKLVWHVQPSPAR
ncbi:MAG: type 4a pilus biogenesis protein PilO [Tepidisphaeraceae bacterium]